MKHLFAFYTAVALAAMTLMACHDDDDEKEKTTQTYTATSVAEAPSWQVNLAGNAAKPDWQEPDPSAYENWTVILVQMEDALEPYVSDDDLMAVFVGGGLRGLAKPAVKIGDGTKQERSSFVIKAYGNEADQNQVSVTLRYYCEKLHQTFSRSVQMKYDMGTVYGLNDDLIPQFSLGAETYPVTMALNVMVGLAENSDAVPAAGDVLAAFVGDECRATFTVDSRLLTVPVTLYVCGREAGETVTLKYYHAATHRVITYIPTVRMVDGKQNISVAM